MVLIYSTITLWDRNIELPLKLSFQNQTGLIFIGDDWISLLTYLGANIKNTAGSAVGVKLNGIYAVFHKPHPGRDIYPSDLKRLRRLLQEAGIQRVE